MRPSRHTPPAGDLCAWIDRLFSDADRGERLERALDERFGDDVRAVTDEQCGELEAVAHEFSLHFTLEYVAEGSLVRDSEPPAGRRRIRARSSSGPVGRRGRATSADSNSPRPYDLRHSSASLLMHEGLHSVVDTRPSWVTTQP